MSPVAEKVEFDYSDNVTASWATTNVSNPWYNCGSSDKDANGVCGFNGVHTSNPNYECTGH